MQEREFFGLERPGHVERRARSTDALENGVIRPDAIVLVDTFINKMNGWLGEGSARHYAISDKGAYAAWL